MSRMSQESDNEYGDFDYDGCNCHCCRSRRWDYDYYDDDNLFDAIWEIASSEKVLE